MSRVIISSILAALVAVAPAALAQGMSPMSPMGGGAVSPEQQQADEIAAELRRIDQQLSPTQQKVMASDASLGEAKAAIGKMIEAKMKASATLGPKLARIEELKAALAASGASPMAQPTPEMQRMIMEGQQLSQELAAAQTDLMAEEPLKSEIASFQGKMTAAIRALDPASGALLDRREALMEQFLALTNAAGPVK